jgi:two-component system OmpR family sensor kinase
VGEKMKGTILAGLASLRGKLGVAAFAALVTTGLLAGMLLLTADSANDVVASARLAQERSRIYLQLQSAATDYQHASFSAVRDASALATRRVAETRTRLENLLAEANRLPTADADDRKASARIDRQVSELIEHFAHSDDIVRSVNLQWRENGGRAALREANRLSAPIFTLRETLQAEITRGDGKVAAATKEADSIIDTAVIASLIALILAFGFSLIVMMLLQTRLRPGLARLEQGATAFGQGKLDHRIALDGNDELSRLSAAFDAMAQTIADKQAALRRVQVGLEQAVAARTAELELANAKLSEADQRRRAFFAEISHELRTPLTIIRGETQIALRAADQPGFDPHEPFDRILEQTELLSRMVNDLFLIAQAQAGGLPLQREVLDLREIAGRVVGDLQYLAAESGGALCLSKGSAVIASVDPDRVKRALLALIENALVHCQKGVKIKVEVVEDEEFASICVHDNGPGIDFEHADQLFERFQRGDSEAEGSGLGLSLVNALVSAHGGKASLHPRATRGTCAKISFPRSAIRQEAA